MDSECDNTSSDECCRFWWPSLIRGVIDPTQVHLLDPLKWQSTLARKIEEPEYRAATFQCHYFEPNNVEREIVEWLEVTQQYLITCTPPLDIFVYEIPDRLVMNDDGELVLDSKAYCAIEEDQKRHERRKTAVEAESTIVKKSWIDSRAIDHASLVISVSA